MFGNAEEYRMEIPIFRKSGMTVADAEYITEIRKSTEKVEENFCTASKIFP